MNTLGKYWILDREKNRTGAAILGRKRARGIRDELNKQIHGGDMPDWNHRQYVVVRHQH